MAFSSMLPSKCTVKRNQNTNSDGVIMAVWVDVATGIPCSVQERKGKTSIGVVGQFLEYDAVGYFKAGANIQPKNTTDGHQPDVLYISAGPGIGSYYEIAKVGDNSGRGHHLVAYLAFTQLAASG